MCGPIFKSVALTRKVPSADTGIIRVLSLQSIVYWAVFRSQMQYIHMVPAQGDAWTICLT